MGIERLCLVSWSSRAWISWSYFGWLPARLETIRIEGVFLSLLVLLLGVFVVVLNGEVDDVRSSDNFWIIAGGNIVVLG